MAETSNPSPVAYPVLVLVQPDLSRIELPSLEDDDALPAQCRCVLSDNDVVAPGCSVLMFDLRSSMMWHCRVGGVGQRRWSRHKYDIGCYDLPEEYCLPPKKKKKNLFDVTAINERFFFINSNGELGTLDFDDVDDGPRLAAIAVPGIDCPEGITVTYLIESVRINLVKEYIACM